MSGAPATACGPHDPPHQAEHQLVYKMVHDDTAPRPASGPLADRIHAALKADLDTCRLIPGDRLSEAELGARLGGSRTPVREALFRLQREGFVEVLPKSGWRVLPLDFARLEALYDLLALLELASVARLCARTDETLPPALEALQATWCSPDAPRPSEPLEVAALDEAFHAALVQQAGNPEVCRVHRDVSEHIRVMRRLDCTRPPRVQACFDEHAKILRAIAARRADVAQYMLRSHIEQSKAEMRTISLQSLYAARDRALVSG